MSAVSYQSSPIFTVGFPAAYSDYGIAGVNCFCHAPVQRCSSLATASTARMSKLVLIADDSVEMRKLLRSTVEAIPECAVCGEAVDGLEVVEKTRELAPDLIILDLAMPRLSGLEAAKVLKAKGILVSIILFTLHANVISPSEASAAGINAVVSKMDGVVGLLREVRRLLRADSRN